ncbi:MAG TPA: acyltransferase [Acetobacteraceae bacterium]|nr:acyltransferase [Acetobacteraceae bacterium]
MTDAPYHGLAPARTATRSIPRSGEDVAGSDLIRTMNPAKIQYLEGLRGIAAVQVVLLHFVTGFLPNTAEHAVPPLKIMWDGHTAVYVFFLISGAVLTPSFARGGRWPRQSIKRLVRLGLPIVVAAVIAFALLITMPDAHLVAARLTGSGWLAMDSTAATTLTHLLREITLDSLTLGYREYTLFTPIAGRLPLLENALNAPSWSLHLELYGSMLVLGLVLLRARAPRVHFAAVAMCAILFGTHPMFLFVLGHICANQLRKPPRPVIGASLIILGLAMSATKDWTVLETVRMAIARFAPAAAPNLFQFQSQMAAVALFIGVLLTPVAQRLLSLCGRLGRLSFSIYLLHFPILFTVACAGFIPLASRFPEPVAVAITFIGFAVIVWLAAEGFERLVDRPSVLLSRRIDPRQQLAPA